MQSPPLLLPSLSPAPPPTRPPQVNNPDFLLWLVAFVATLLLGVVEGIGAAILLSLLWTIYKSAFPRVGEAEVSQPPRSPCRIYMYEATKAQAFDL